MIDEFTSELQELLVNHGVDKECGLEVWVVGRYLNESLNALKITNKLIQDSQK